MPVACYSYKKKLVYLTGKRIANLFCKAVKAIHPRALKAKFTVLRPFVESLGLRPT
jgi:hypothetical protein